MEPSSTLRLLGVAGSLRAASYNRMLLNAVVAATPDTVEMSVWDQLKQLPPFDEDDEHAPGPAVHDLRRAIASADALLVVTPEYNGSVPGQLKNAIDWASRPRTSTVLRDKPVAVIGASPSPGGARAAQADARRILARAGARVLDLELVVARAYTHFDDRGHLNSLGLRSELDEFLRRLADHAGLSAPVVA